MRPAVRHLRHSCHEQVPLAQVLSPCGYTCGAMAGEAACALAASGTLLSHTNPVLNTILVTNVQTVQTHKLDKACDNRNAILTRVQAHNAPWPPLCDMSVILDCRLAHSLGFLPAAACAQLIGCCTHRVASRFGPVPPGAVQGGNMLRGGVAEGRERTLRH